MTFDVYPVETPSGTRFYADVVRARDGKVWTLGGFAFFSDAMDEAMHLINRMPA